MPESFTSQLCALVEHPDDGIKKATLAALCRCSFPVDERLARVLQALADSPDHNMRLACIQCYRLLPAGDRERLATDALIDRHPSVVEAALGVLEETSEDLPAHLFAWLAKDFASPRQQQQIITYLSQKAVSRQAFEAFASRKLDDAAALSQALRVLETDRTRSDGGSALVKIVIGERFVQTLQVALLAIENLSDSHSIRIVYMALKSKDKRQVARAREALANVANTRLGAQLGQLLMLAADPNAIVDLSSNVPQFKTAHDALGWCRDHVDDWLKRCAAYALSRAPAARVHG